MHMENRCFFTCASGILEWESSETEMSLGGAGYGGSGHCRVGRADAALERSSCHVCSLFIYHLPSFPCVAQCVPFLLFLHPLSFVSPLLLVITTMHTHSSSKGWETSVPAHLSPPSAFTFSYPFLNLGSRTFPL